MAIVAPNAFVDPKAELGSDVEVAHGCFIGPKVRVGDGSRLLPNVTIMGNTRVGEGNVFYPSAVIGAAPQDLKYRGGDTQLLIGNNNTFRECTTVHPGTETGGGVTQIGDNNQFQVGSHIAHDVRVGDNCVLSNQVQIAGHVVIEDCVNISGLVGVQQFVTIGQFSFIVGATRCTKDVPPYLILRGFDAEPVAVNEEGLRRWGIVNDDIEELKDLYKKLFSRKASQVGANISDRIAAVESNGALSTHSRRLVEFLKRSVDSGVCGRYLESRRGDADAGLPKFYEKR
jgi:UDP-N-acetylglucosamine acyltransferase